MNEPARFNPADFAIGVSHDFMGIRVVFLDSPIDDFDVEPGDGLIVPKGMWHRVDILEPSQIVYLTPGPNNEYKSL
jgi:homogentisate 1,2-dioxygenase